MPFLAIDRQNRKKSIKQQKMKKNVIQQFDLSDMNRTLSQTTEYTFFHVSRIFTKMHNILYLTIRQ